MKLSMWTSYYMDLSPEDAIREIAKNEYKYAELSDEHAAELLKRGEPKEVGKAFKAFADAQGVQMPQGHLYLKVRLRDKEQPVVPILKNWLDLFLACGVCRAVLHCDTVVKDGESLNQIQEENAAVLRELVAYLEGTDMVICLENLGPKSRVRNAEELLWYIREIGEEHLGICLDTGHLNLTEFKDQASFIHAAGKHLKALHIADNEGENDQHLMPFGRGTVDIQAVVRALKEIGYDGLFNFEIPGERSCPLPVRGFKLQYIQNMVNYLESVSE